MAQFNGIREPDRRVMVVTGHYGGGKTEFCVSLAMRLAKAGCAPGECAFVGDNLEADVLGAIAAGMRGVWLRRPDQPDRDIPGGASLTSLEGLPEMIETL